MSAGQDLNPHPSVSGQVPLPLDHLHSMISSLLNSYPRAFVSGSITLTFVHVHCMHRVLWDANTHAHHPLIKEMLHFCCVSVKVCDRKATWNSVPLCYCESCAPQASSEASVYTMSCIPDRLFDKIAIDLVTDCKTSTSGNKHILTIIDHLTGWPEAFPILDKSADTIVATLINQYLPVHICPGYILSDNGTEFKNNLMDQVLQQLEIDRIFSAPYYPQSNGKLQVFHKYLKPTLKKLCEKDPANWDKYLNQVLTSYRIMPNLATAELPFFLVYGRDHNLPLHQLLEPMQHFLGDPDSGKLHLETHRLALAIAKKTLDENRFTATQKTLARDNPAFQVGDHVYFKNKQPGKWDLKWRPGYQIVHIECNGHFIHIENQATGKTQSCNITDILLEPPVKFWNIDTQFGRASCYINHPANLPTIQLVDTL